MLTFLGSKQRFCDGMSRRGFLTAGALSLGGLTLADILRLKAQGAVRASRLKSIIMVYLHGGPSHIDTFDMKPDAPAEIRGEFKPIRTNLPGLQVYSDRIAPVLANGRVYCRSQRGTLVCLDVRRQ